MRFIDPRTIYGERYEDAADKFPEANKLMSLGWQPKYGLNDTVDAVHASMRKMPAALMRRVAGLQ